MPKSKNDGERVHARVHASGRCQEKSRARSGVGGAFCGDAAAALAGGGRTLRAQHKAHKFAPPLTAPPAPSVNRRACSTGVPLRAPAKQNAQSSAFRLSQSALLDVLLHDLDEFLHMLL